MTSKQKILIAPLDWGLGHATRCIPVIRELLRQNEEVIFAADRQTAALLKNEFPELKLISLNGYRISYSKWLPMSVTMLLQSPKILLSILREHRELKKIISEEKIDAVISDNRYGLWNKKIHSVFITHQVMIKCPAWLRFLEPVLYRINKFFILKYDECWVPDDDQKLSGDLAHRYQLPSNAKLIGTLSRWKGEKVISTEKKYDVLGIVSGPEPHRSSFEKLLIQQSGKSKQKFLIVSGKPNEQNETVINENLSIVSHLNSKKLLEAITNAATVICRSGYSGIMDLEAIGKRAILVPTPGQTEQIYLAEYLQQKKKHISISQKKFQSQNLPDRINKITSGNFRKENNSLPQIIEAWRKKITVC